MLSCCLIAYLRKSDVKRLLTDNEYLERLIRKEARNIDIAGWFLDTISQEMLDNGERMELMTELDKLGHYFYTKLDKERLRKAIVDNYQIYFKTDITTL